MDEQRDRQSIPPTASPQAGYAPQPGYSQAAPSPAQPAALPPVEADMFGRLLRLLLRRLTYGVLIVDRLIRPRLGWVIFSALLLGVIGLQSAALLAPLIVRSVGNTDQRVAAIAVSPAVESFLRGQARYDADTMWDAFSPDFQAFLAEKGVSKDALAQQAQSERDGGQKYTRYAYVGGVGLPNNGTMYFYAVDIESSQADRNGTFSFVFTVDKSGKIVGLRL